MGTTGLSVTGEYDSSAHRRRSSRSSCAIVLFGGQTSTGAAGETWIYKDGAWEQRQTPSAPEPRFGHAMAYMPTLGKVVLFGGWNGSSRFGGTWLWDGHAWEKLGVSGRAELSQAVVGREPTRGHP